MVLCKLILNYLHLHNEFAKQNTIPAHQEDKNFSY